MGKDLHHCFPLDTFKRETASHDHAYITGAQADSLFSGDPSFNIDESLGRPGGKDACGPGTGDIQLPPAALSATHRKDARFRLQAENPFAIVHSGDLAVRRYLRDHGFRGSLNV